MCANRQVVRVLVMFAWCIVALAPQWAVAQDPTYQETDGLEKLKDACSRLRTDGHKLPPQTRALLNAQGEACLTTEKLYYDGKQPVQLEIKAFDNFGILHPPITDDEKAKRRDKSKKLDDRISQDGEQVAARYAEFVRTVDQSLLALTIPVAKDHWTGDWQDDDKNLVKVTLGSFQDKELRDWIAKHVSFNKLVPVPSSVPVSMSDMIGASNGNLHFGGGFFTNVKISADSSKTDEIEDASNLQVKRENVVAFDGGRAVFFHIKGEMPQKGDLTLEDFLRKHENVILLMKSSQYRGQESEISDVDFPEAIFAHAFRAAALKLKKPQDPKITQKEWDNVVGEIRKRMGLKPRQ